MLYSILKSKDTVTQNITFLLYISNRNDLSIWLDNNKLLLKVVSKPQMCKFPKILYKKKKKKRAIFYISIFNNQISSLACY